jgi:hypothetical protein
MPETSNNFTVVEGRRRRALVAKDDERRHPLGGFCRRQATTVEQRTSTRPRVHRLAAPPPDRRGRSPGGRELRRHCRVALATAGVNCSAKVTADGQSRALTINQIRVAATVSQDGMRAEPVVPLLQKSRVA